MRPCSAASRGKPQSPHPPTDSGTSSMTMQPWFADAKLGIFLHWGIYAVDGVAESWSFYADEVSYDAYMAQLDGFTAAAFDSDAWAGLFARAGARYTVLTAKHHDGVALWDTAQSDLSVVKRTPAGRDLLAEYVGAMRRHGLRTGLYFSHLDWSHPDYATLRHTDPTRPWITDNPYTMPPEGQEDPERWERYLVFHRAQLRELVTGYEPDLLWFDGHWERSESQWRMSELRQELLAMKADVVLNARMLGHGDYATPEQGVPISPSEGPWELCLTINDSWGHRAGDTNHKSVGQIIRTFAETIGAGGNLLLAVGPTEDGTITPEQTARLEGLGSWIERNREAVHGTERGVPFGHHYGPTTLSKDRRTLYLHCLDAPREFVALRGLVTPVKRVSVLGTGAGLAHRTVGGFAGHGVPGVLYIDPPAELDPHITVIAVELDGELELYRGAGHG
ncbi:alpha-L-fucosidase [Streptomyces sp. FIT100]|uniref:alpha-L-fucosidase n=1 Tax=Streptomyces sp. FIT100 TaxID=2837956 RepID=UPI0021C58344|nr:alpha-L-fucosidase [Streptomyces sp. FIT100]